MNDSAGVKDTMQPWSEQNYKDVALTGRLWCMHAAMNGAHIQHAWPVISPQQNVEYSIEVTNKKVEQLKRDQEKERKREAMSMRPSGN